MALLEEKLWLLLPTFTLAILLAGSVRRQAGTENTGRRPRAHELEVLYDPESSEDDSGKGRGPIIERVLRFNVCRR
jgi:hypothetical protein